MTWTFITYHLEWGALLLSCGFRDIQALYSIEPLQVWWCTGLPFCVVFCNLIRNLMIMMVFIIFRISQSTQSWRWAAVSVVLSCVCALDDLFCSLSIHVFFGQLIIALHNLHVIIFFYFIDLFWFGVTWFRVLFV